jgi:small subunit ribosomal protein S13
MRISGITIKEDQRLEIALTGIYGIGRPMAKKILADVGVDIGTKTPDLTPVQESTIREMIEARTIEGELRRSIQTHIKRLKDIKSYRGSRHAKRLPARGQRSKTNNRTVRGNVRKTMTSGRRKLEKT